MKRGTNSNATESRLKVQSLQKMHKKNTNDIKLSDPMNELPAEIATHIMSFLPLASLASAQQVSQNWKTISDTDLIWKQKAKENNVPSDDYQEPSRFKRSLKKFAAICKKIRNSYPKKLIETFGGAQNIAKLPLLNFAGRNPHYYSTRENETMQGAEIKRGYIIPFSEDLSQIPIIRICAKNNDAQNSKPIVEDLEIYFGDNNILYSSPRSYATSPLFLFVNIIKEEEYEYLGRLIRHEPCGALWREEINNDCCVKMEGTRTLEDGRSVIELTDQRELQNNLEPDEATLESEVSNTNSIKNSIKRKFGSN